ncbi:IclR family transcriptional regulator [Amycolatopsis sacchari]|uniref:DNA-binding transcriptional regulator, IclR family n=1 Tax=Amycolatopsis sacchari TaxID=115433 RepID=A0A1I3T4R7_9PSEU|nr:IclR family transcriptional regulator [Amycolatopsis sacchari]SFJ64487.1 DNA-binding transcriptional regulator, IclR family [Amycolatopsis sacchari]
MAGRTNTPGQTVSRRLLSVLDCFDVAHPALSLTEVATRSGLPVSTARRLIGELCAWGGLERLDDGRYRVGMRLWTIGSLAPRQRGLREAALPFMHDLFQATQENIQLTVLEGTQALCIDKISSSKAVPTMTHIGGRLPLHATGVGKAILAFSDKELLRSVADAGLARMTPHTITQPGRLAAALAEVRKTGVAYCYEEMTLGAVSVAAPVLGLDGKVRAALGIVAHSRAAVDRLAPAVRAAALGIARWTG